ncbi:hypothetical protein PLICRDRAFT_603031 [Plicaturopsis crispa FD-325 SS-3]|nr:hypothetical protein PLICRDRAFT_603031 [Plicaturopsis crispa FD-325 SS-3]
MATTILPSRPLPSFPDQQQRRQQHHKYRHSPSNSILLNPQGESQPIRAFAGSAASSMYTPTPSHSPVRSNQRSRSTPRIRFAPLPDPRRAVFLSDDGVELPLDQELSGDTSVASSPAVPPVPLPPLDTPSSSSSSAASVPAPSTPLCHPMPQLARTSSPAPSVSSSTTFPCAPPTPTASKSRSYKKLLKPFLKRSSSPCPPMAGGSGFGGISTEDILTLGAINLFRSSSRQGDERRQDENSGLSRWTSAGSSHSHRAKGKEAPSSWHPFGSPLARSQSAQAALQPTKSKSAAARARSQSNTGGTANNGLSTLSTGTVRTGTRMLNGRVYGGGRNDLRNKNLFASARDEEPAFVEWGYGGMGSVHAQHSVWGKLQSTGSAVGGDAPGRTSSADDDDDGSGIGWVKRRREQREREKAAAEAAKALESVVEGDPTSPTSPVAEGASSPPPPHSTSPPPVSASPRAMSPVADHTPKDEDKGAEHVLTVASVPAPPHHVRTNSRIASRSGSYKEESKGEALAAQTPVQDDDADDDEDKQDDDEEESEETRSASDDEDEDEEDETQGLMVVGAGVEKISRHKDQPTETT